MTGSNLHEVEKNNLLGYKSDFEVNGTVIIGRAEQKTNIRFRIMYDFESFINAIDIDINSERVTFTRYVYKLKTPQFRVVKSSAYAKSTNYLEEIVEFNGKLLHTNFRNVFYQKQYFFY